MKPFTSTLIIKQALHICTFTALCLGLVAVAPANAQESERARMVGLHKTLSANRPPPTESGNSERSVLVTGTDLLSDGGFEGGYYGGSQTIAPSGVTGPWTWNNSPAFLNPIWENYGSVTAHSGIWLVYFNPSTSSASRLYQTVSIPSGSTATLSFWLWVGTLETTQSYAYDTLTVSIADTNGTALGSHAYSNLDSTASWVKHTLDVSAYAGRTVRVQFDTHEDSTKETVFLLDDVSLVASSVSASCVEDANTMCLVGGRYKVTSHWLNQYATPPSAANLKKTKLTDNVGAFWIADANTYEYFIRFNTATTNGKIWVNVSTFTSVEFWVSVTDTVTGQTKEYHSPAGTDAFNTVNIWDPYYFVYP